MLQHPVSLHGVVPLTFLQFLRKMTFLMCFITLFVVFSILMFEYVPNGIYFVPFASVPVVILVFFDSRTAIFSLLVTVLISSLVAVFPYQFIFMELTAGLLAAFSISSSQPAVAAASHSRLHLSGILSDLFCIESHNRRQS